MKNKTYANRILLYSKKYKAIQLLGGKCEKCGEDRFFRLTFHHIDFNKENEINKMKNFNWKIIENEVNKCILLCRNCHQEFHYKEKESIYKKSKQIYLEYKNMKECIECGYNKCNESLTFHHIKDKKIKLSGCRVNNLDKIKDSVIEELNNCDVLCHNCHTEKHSDLNFFKENINLIIEKSKNLRHKSSKIDREIVKKMYFENNMRQKDIVIFFNCSKSTISEIIKELKINMGI